MPALEITYLMVEPINKTRTGGDVYNQRVINYLKSKGVVVDIFTLRDINEIGKDKTFIRSNLKLIQRLLLKSKAKKIIVEAFYMHPWFFIFNWIARLFTDVKLISFVQLFDYHYQSNALLRFIDELVSAFALLPVHRAIVNSLTTAKGCERLGLRKRNIKVVYPGCDYARINCLRKDTNDAIVELLSVSNYVPRKGLHFLIHAIAFIKQKYPEVYDRLNLKIVGYPDDIPSYAKILERLISENFLVGKVELLGWRDRSDLKELFLKSDVFIFTGIEEGFGMVLAEAMQFGLPIISFSSGSALELIEHNWNGILVPTGNTHLLAEAICKLVSDRELRIKLGNTSKKRSQKFVQLWEETGEQFYQTILEMHEEMSKVN